MTKKKIAQRTSTAVPAATTESAPAPSYGGDRPTLILFGLMASLPFLQPYHNLPIPSFQTEWLAMLLGLFGFTLLMRSAGNGYINLPFVAAAAPLLAATVLLQWLIGMFAYPASALLILFYLLWSAMLAVAGRTLVERVGARTVVSWLAWFILLSGLLNAVFGMLQYFHLSPAFDGLISEPMALSIHGIYGNLAQQNHFATHLALALASTIYLVFLRQLSIAGCASIAAVLLAAMVLSGSRGVFLHIGWISALALWHLRGSGRNSRRFLWWIVGLPSIAFIALWLLAQYAAIPQIARLTHFSEAFGPRVFLWHQAWSMFVAHPLLGVGFDNFAAQLVDQLAAAKTRNLWGIDQYAHNIFLQLMAVSGLVGLLAFAIPMLLFVRRQLRMALTTERMWLWSGLGVLAIHSLLEQPLFYTYFLGLAALMAGIADPGATAYRFHRSARITAKIACAVLVLLMLKTAQDYDDLQGQFFSARYADNNNEVKLKTLDRLHTYSILSPLTELVAPAVFSPIDSSPKEKIAFNLRVMHYAPTAENEYRHAVLLADDGRTQDAMRQFDKAAYAYPDDVAQYAQRFAALGARDPDRYAILAAHVRDFAQAK